MDKDIITLKKYFGTEDTHLPFRFEDIHHKTPYDSNIGHSHDHYAIYLFSNGGGNHSIDFNNYECSTNSICVLFPHQFHQISIEKQARGSVVFFSEALFSSDMLPTKLRAYCVNLKSRLNSIKLTQSQFVEIVQLFGMIRLLSVSKNIFQQEQTRHVIQLILLKLMDFSKIKELNSTETVEYNIFLQYTNLVDEQYKEIRQVGKYARKVGISAKKLNEISKHFNYQTALQVIHDRIFLEAKRLLSFSGYTHKEISHELKFDSLSEFTKFIYSKSDCTPSELKAKLAQIHKKK